MYEKGQYNYKFKEMCNYLLFSRIQIKVTLHRCLDAD